ncbi:hypothetical protein [Streptomyces sp. NPDC048516]|uniref:hypothetical protein n=1 Tax=Streptomyces sp. NPDC048516 TaxID=3365565 RepID=UPI0037134783
MNFTRTLRAVGGAMAVGALLFGTASVASADQIRHDQRPLRSFGAHVVGKVSTGSKNGPLPALSDAAPAVPAKSLASGGEYQPKGNKVAIVSIAGGVVVLLIVILVVVTVTVKKKRRNGPPPGGPGGYGGPGGPGFPGGFVPQPPGPYQQQPSAPGTYPPAPYQQQPSAPGTYPPGTYQQQPGAPASFPPAPPTPPSNG